MEAFGLCSQGEVGEGGEWFEAASLHVSCGVTLLPVIVGIIG